MYRLAGVFLKVRAGQADAPPLAFAEVDVEMAAAHHGVGQLADLIALRQVGIEVVLAVEAALAGDFAFHGKAERHRHAECALVQHRQNAGQPQVHARGAAVGVAACRHRRVGEDLRFGGELNVHLEPNHAFPVRAH